MIQKLTSALAMAVTLTLTQAPVAKAGGDAVVVELFTSQGCSSCPPADALLHKLSEYDDVIPLALHVDYWDYIGWKDSFASPMHTVRQKAYAEVGGRRMIYTPQMIIMGMDDVVGADAMKVSELVEKHRRQPNPVSLETRRDGDVASVSLNAIADVAGSFVVQLVRYAPKAEVSISRGELAGRTMQYSNIVQDWQQIGRWDGVEPVSIQFPMTGETPGVVIVQHDNAGPIVAAVRLN